jgi:hypothetical protein
MSIKLTVLVPVQPITAIPDLLDIGEDLCS